MASKAHNMIGVLQGRLTPSNGRGIQFFPDTEWREEFSNARKIGFSCIELLVKKDGYRSNPLFTEAGIGEILELQKKYGIETPSVHGFYSSEPWYSDAYCTLISQASLVGARTILVSFFNDMTLRTDADKEKARSQLARPLTCAEKYGISIAIEAEIAATELKKFIESFHSPAIGVYYDIGNMASMNVDIAEDIEALGQLIKGVHVKDRLRNGGESVRLGTGGANFDAAFDALNRIGYNGPYIIQGARDTHIDDVTLNATYLNFVQKLITKIQTP